MAVRDIVRFPDPRLRVEAEPVSAFDVGLAALVEDLSQTLIALPAIGLTAPHIGVQLRVFVLRLTPADAISVYVNPEIVERSGATARHTEGSISMPGVTEEIERAARVKVRYQTLDGAEQTEHAEGFRAACQQHEIDQLDGIFWIERLSRLRRERLLKRYRKAQGPR